MQPCTFPNSLKQGALCAKLFFEMEAKALGAK
jgi:hypothetical protein